MDYKYLKDDQYYIDQYDLHTIEQCLDHYWSMRDGFNKEKDKQFAKYTKEKFEQEINKCINLFLYTLKGERYRNKKETIQKWKDKDLKMQELHDNTPPPSNVLCKVCHSSTVLTDKDLHNSYEDNARMVFMFECTNCKKRQALFEDCTEWKYDAPKCPKCKHNLKTDLKIKDDITIFTSTCLKCGYKDKNESDHKKWRAEHEAKEKKDKELLEKYRSEFCLSDKEGQDYIGTSEAMEVASVIREEERQKYDSPVYERSLQLKKTSISNLEKLLINSLEKTNYTKLSFDKPEIGQYVIVPFTVLDTDSTRKDKTSSSELEKIIKTVIDDTNWRLVSNSITYRLGYLEGRLKGYEQEDDMLKLAGKKDEVKPKSKIDEVMRQKYATNNLVQLARIFGEADGIDAMRKRRLEKEPDGFILNDGKVGYTCGICRETISGNNTWWDLNGIRCLDCQRNLKEGIVPKEIFEDDYGYDVVVKDWELKSYYGIHPATVRKLHRKGILKGRDLKRKDGSVYETLFVISENKEFFKDHPKNDSKIKITVKD